MKRITAVALLAVSTSSALAAEREDAARAAATQRTWAQQMADAIAKAWQGPPGLSAQLYVKLELELLPGCTVKRVTIVQPSVSPTFDASAAAAVFNASPLPCVDPPAFQPLVRPGFTPESLTR